MLLTCYYVVTTYKSKRLQLYLLFENYPCVFTAASCHFGILQLNGNRQRLFTLLLHICIQAQMCVVCGRVCVRQHNWKLSVNCHCNNLVSSFAQRVVPIRVWFRRCNACNLTAVWTVHRLLSMPGHYRQPPKGGRQQSPLLRRKLGASCG